MTETDEMLHEYFKKMISLAPEKSMDEGIGTKYERLVMDDWFKQLATEFHIESVLEYPCDGITGLLGINSLIFLKEGKKVALCNPFPEMREATKRIWGKLGYNDVDIVPLDDNGNLPFPENTFDLVWNFCMMERYADPNRLVQEMARVSRKYVLLMTQNWHNWGTYLHKTYHAYKKDPWDHGYKQYMMFGGIRKVVNAADLKIVEEGGIDIPPIIDTWNTPIRGTLQSFLKVFGKKWEYKHEECENDKKNSSGLINFFYSLEKRLPVFFKKYQAHHLYVFAEKKVHGN
ncbi:MAG: methyltransferase domain-containing protein [Promethearchaeota archaeon]